MEDLEARGIKWNSWNCWNDGKDHAVAPSQGQAFDNLIIFVTVVTITRGATRFQLAVLVYYTSTHHFMEAAAHQFQDGPPPPHSNTDNNMGSNTLGVP